MRGLWKVVMVAGLAFIAAGVATARRPPPGPATSPLTPAVRAALAQVDRLLADTVKERNLPGLSAAWCTIST